MLKHLFLPIILAGIVSLSGCKQAPPPGKVASKPDVAKAKKPDALRLGLDLIRQATDAPHLRDGLNLLNTELQASEIRAKLVLSAETRTHLQESVGLTPEELQEVEAPTFRPADAHFLAACMLFRDVARTLEIPGMTPEQQVRRVFDWVMRHVLLHEHGDDGLPPAHVLQRGYGGAPDRAIVFLSLMRQFSMEGCLIVLPTPRRSTVLVGVQNADKQDLLLFDPRLGLPILTPQGKVATLKEARGDESLFAAAGITSDDAKRLEGRLALPLAALAPRMRELERLLGNQDRIILSASVSHVLADFGRSTSGLPVHAWDSKRAGKSVENSPLRSLIQFLPTEEGGSDSTGQRLKTFSMSRIPWSHALRSFEQMKLGQDLAAPARERLFLVSADLFEKYSQQPHASLLRGDYDKALGRLDRIRTFLNDETLDAEGDKEFPGEVADWRERLNKAYHELLVAKDPRGQANVNNLWSEDIYLLTLLQAEGEERPEARKKERKVLTKIVAHAIREPLGQHAGWLQALAWHEKAAKGQALLDLPAKNRPAAQASTGNAWNNAQIHWNLYVDRLALSPLALQQRLEHVRARGRDGAGFPVAVGLLEHLHLDLHHHFAAKVNRAEALAHLKRTDESRGLLKATLDEIERLRKGDDGQGASLKKEIESLQANPLAPPVLAKSLALLAEDWTEQGHFHWIGRHAETRLAALPKN